MRSSFSLLPEPAQLHALSFLPVASLLSVEATGRGLKALLSSRIADELLWRETVAITWSRGIGLGREEEEERNEEGRGGRLRRWRGVAEFLESVVWPTIRSAGVKPALAALDAQGMIRLAEGGSDAVRWKWASRVSMDVVRSCFRFHADDLEAKRRVALFVCSADFAGAPAIQDDDDDDDDENYDDEDHEEGDKEGNEKKGCDELDGSSGGGGGSDEGNASDDSLPDLNEAAETTTGGRGRGRGRGRRGSNGSGGGDSGRGGGSDDNADGQSANLRRVLRLFSSSSLGAEAVDPEDALRRLLLEFPFLPIDAGEGADRAIKAVARMYLESHPQQLERMRERASNSSSSSSRRLSYGGVPATTPQQQQHDDPESAVYILLYAVIMLNTDLHNPKIKPKMTCAEFVRSTQSTVLRDTFSGDELSRIYRSIAKKALTICASNRSPKELRLKNLHAPPSAITAAAAAASNGRRSLYRNQPHHHHPPPPPPLLLPASAQGGQERGLSLGMLKNLAVMLPALPWREWPQRVPLASAATATAAAAIVAALLAQKILL